MIISQKQKQQQSATQKPKDDNGIDALRLPIIKNEIYSNRNSVFNSSATICRNNGQVDIYKETTNQYERQLSRTPHHIQLKLATTTHLYINHSQLIQPQKNQLAISYKYVALPGNNSEIVNRLLSHRNWSAANENDVVNLRWHPTDYNYRYERHQAPNKMLFNHFQFHGELSNKSSLVRNMRMFCERKQMNVFDLTPLTFTVNLDSRNYEAELGVFSQFFTRHQPQGQRFADKNIYINERGIQIKSKVRNEKQIQIHQLSTSFQYCKHSMHKSYINGQSYLWMLKPTGLNRGRGIHVFNNLKRVEELLNQYYDGFNESDENKKSSLFIKWNSFVLQKYVERPLLIYGRKFDIRMWALVTHQMELYVFREGYLRTSCETYTVDENKIDDTYVHLTNNAIQKFSNNYGQYEAGNQLSFQEFQKYLDENGHGISFYDKMLPRMRQLIQISVSSVKNKLNRNELKHCFEIFGYDFIIDEFYNVWLIEVNTNPCIELSSPLLKQLVPRMLNDAFNLTLDIMFPPQLDSLQVKTEIQAATESPSKIIEQVIEQEVVTQPTTQILEPQQKKKHQRRSKRNIIGLDFRDQMHLNYNFYNNYEDLSKNYGKLQYNAEAESYLRTMLSQIKQEKEEEVQEIQKEDLQKEQETNQENDLPSIEEEELDLIQKQDSISLKSKKFLQYESETIKNQQKQSLQEIKNEEIASNDIGRSHIIDLIIKQWRKSFPVRGQSSEDNMWDFETGLGIKFSPVRRRN